MSRKKKGGNDENLSVRVKTAKGRKTSSTRWLKRQLNDPYVRKAKADGYRSRAAYKLLEINTKHKLFKPGMNIVDLGAAPGSWSQVALQELKGKGKVVGIDLLAVEPMEGLTFLQGDFLDEATYRELETLMNNQKVDMVMSDMASNASGHPQTDHIRIMALCEAALEFAVDWLNPDGIFLAKVLQGGTEGELLKHMKQYFQKTYHIKPEASRSDSSEMYVLATGFRER